MNNSDIIFEVVLRYNELKAQPGASPRLTDIYLIISGNKCSTRKIYLNNYELKKFNRDSHKEKYFEFSCKDVGKIEHINFSINEDNNPSNCLYVDFIEIKIQNRSEAYKFFFLIFIEYGSPKFYKFNLKDFQLKEV